MENHAGKRWWRWLVRILGGSVLLVLASYLAFQLSPWPGALLIRFAFDREAVAVAAAQAKYVPAGLSEQRNLRYDQTDADALLDVFVPQAQQTLAMSRPTIVWIHGGGYVSGSKDQIANYARVMAGQGYAVVGVGYSIAPGATYPTPLLQVNRALTYLKANAATLPINGKQFVLAGDSAGAHMAAQLAAAFSSPEYASLLGLQPALTTGELRGVVLYCGPYDIRNVNLDGPFGGFMHTVLWAYSGSKSFQTDARFATASVIEHLTPGFPPAFISAGNADPLEPHSHALAQALLAQGVPVQTLFFPRDFSPGLPHEYQFVLDTAPAQQALQTSLSFLRSLER